MDDGQRGSDDARQEILLEVRGRPTGPSLNSNAEGVLGSPDADGQVTFTFF